MRDYELVYIVNPQLIDENLTGVLEKVSQFISSRGGQVDRVDTWGRRRLAYPIATFREGTYILTQFKMDPAQAPDLENSLRTSEEIIRHLMIRLDEAQVRARQQQLAQQKQREEQERAQREQAVVQAAAQAAAAQAAAQQAAAEAAQAPAPEATPEAAPEAAPAEAVEQPAEEAQEQAPEESPETS